MPRTFDAVEVVNGARSRLGGEPLIAWSIIYLAMTIEAAFAKPQRVHLESLWEGKPISELTPAERAAMREYFTGRRENADV